MQQSELFYLDGTKTTIMKKTIIGALVGAVIMFIWQFISFGAINLHRPAQQYTEKQDAIMEFLNNQALPEGGYIMPSVPEGATAEEMEAAMEAGNGRPWAYLQYHKSAENSSMSMNMIRGFFTNLIILFVFIWLLRRMAPSSKGRVLLASLAIGFIAFLHFPYTNFIWYETFDIWAHLLDTVVIWGVVGLWLAWLLRREFNAVREVH